MFRCDKTHIIAFLLLSAVTLFSACSTNGINEPEEDEWIVIPIFPIPSFGYADRYPAANPNSELVAFIRDLGTSPPDSVKEGLYLINLFSRDVSLLIEGTFGRPAWLDTSTILVPLYSSAGGGRLFSINIQSKELIPISTDPVSNPSVSRTDSIVVYDYEASLRALDIKTHYSWEIIDGGFNMPSLSADGDLIAAQEIVLSGSASTISILDTNGSNVVRLIDPRLDYYYTYPTWSDTGLYIVCEVLFMNEDNISEYRIIMIDIALRKCSDITEGLYPCYSNNIQQIFYSGIVRDRNNQMRIFMCNITGGEKEQITY